MYGDPDIIKMMAVYKCDQYGVEIPGPILLVGKLFFIKDIV